MMDELQEQVEALQVTTTPRRSGRKRSLFEPASTPPAKVRKNKPSILTDDKLKKFYMNKMSAKFVRQALETIYEDPQIKNGTPLLIGGAKIKRTISMDFGSVTKTKKQVRKKKIKRLGMRGVRYKKLSDEEFKKKLLMIEAFLNTESLTETPEKDSSSHPTCPMDDTGGNVGHL